MNKLLTALLAGSLALPLAARSAPDEAQKELSRHAHEAKEKLAAAEGASGAEREKMMQEHMKMMQAMMAQMEKARPAAAMKPEQMREWIDEHLKLMQEMMGQMMDEHHLMMQGGTGMGGMQGMGKK